MKTLVLYDSNFGNTKAIAEEIAKNFADDVKVLSVKQFEVPYLNDIELLIVGSPINGWRPTEAVVELLHSLKDKITPGLKFTTFDTRVKLFIHGDAKNKMADILTSLGAKLIVEPQAFYVGGKKGPMLDGELEKVDKWAELIKLKLS